MPRGKYTNHKGRSRKFTNPEELEEERRRNEQEKQWRKQRGEVSSTDDEEDDNEHGTGSTGKSGAGGSSSRTPASAAGGDKSSSGDSSSDEDSSEDEDRKAKGVSNLIEIENPNRVQKKAKKVTALDVTKEPAGPQLTRREREELEKQRAKDRYDKLHAEGKTDQARADLARLAIIKQQREEARVRREKEIKDKEDAAKQKSAQTQKAMGKK